jgi:iron-sulfur cluster insertion protein
MVEKFVPKELNITENAVLKVKNLIAEENNKNLNLRVFVTGGGCSGFQYGFKLDDNAEDDDTVLKEGNVSVLIDSLSIQYLFGSTLDYVENLEGSKFIIENPNATTTCGCGASFSI